LIDWRDFSFAIILTWFVNLGQKFTAWLSTVKEV